MALLWGGLVGLFGARSCRAWWDPGRAPVSDSPGAGSNSSPHPHRCAGRVSSDFATILQPEAIKAG
jgi:hypothetical protein